MKKAASSGRESSVTSDAGSVNKSDQFLPDLLRNITTHNIIFFLLVKALIIAVLINFHIVSLLPELGPGASTLSPVSEQYAIDSPLSEAVSDQVESKDVLACVTKNAAGDCEAHPCVKEHGSIRRVDEPDRPFGYGGRFVQRNDNVDKPLMQTIGDRGWGSGCVVSDEYKFVYIHVLKSGGTATKEFLRKALCGEDDKDCKRVDPHILRPAGCRGAILNYTDYFTFSFVRNPFSRMYSMYSMMDGFPVEQGQQVTDAFSFHDFVMKPNERKNHTTMHAGHYDRQKNFIFSNHTCPSFDFLGRVEHYDEDMRTILTHLNATKLIAYLDKLGGTVHPANTWGSIKKKSIGGDLRKEYSSKMIVDRVAALYKKDFDILGYDKQIVPSN